MLELCKCEFAVVPGDMQGAVEPPTDRDRVSGWWKHGFRAFKLDVVSVEGDAIVVENRSGSSKAEDIVALWYS